MSERPDTDPDKIQPLPGEDEPLPDDDDDENLPDENKPLI